MDYANKRWWSVVLIVATIAATQTWETSAGHPGFIRDEEGSRRIITQFYNYVDVITGLKLDNMLKLTQVFVQQLLDSIPGHDRGNTAQMLEDYISNVENIREDGGSIEEKELMLMELQQLIATIKSGLAQEEKEDIILRRGLLGMFELLARLSIEERKFNDKFAKAATLLRLRMAEESVERHRELIDLLQAIDSEQDIVVRERLFEKFKQIRHYHTSQ
uniref:Uncharacterized protein n=1 Tax=Stomoxys calcitrans TaxID=35570 RepID=A0A1I8P0U5_STOCA